MGETIARPLRELASTEPAKVGDDGPGSGPEGDTERVPRALGQTLASGAGELSPSSQRPRGRDIVARLHFYRGFATLFADEVATPRLGKYEVVEQIGCGGNGVVLGGRNPDLDEEVAIKVLRQHRLEGGSKEGARLLREARVLAKLKHPNIVPIYDAGEEDGELYIVMRRVRGTTLLELQQERPWREIVDLYVAAARGLAAVHAAGLVHRDFKAENVLVDEDGSVLLADFGLVCEARDETGAARLQEHLRRSAFVGRLTGGGFPGTPAYMAPEILDGGPANVRWDVYSLSASLYEALYSRLPFTGDTPLALILAAEGGGAPARPSDAAIPEWLDDVIRRGLSPKPEARYASVDAMLDALDYRRRERDEAAAQEGLRRRGWYLFGGVGAAIVGLILGVKVFSGAQDDPCERDELAAVWDEEARGAIDDGGVGGRLRGLIDAQAARWRGSFAALCEVRASQSPVLYDTRMGCLREHRLTLEALIRAAMGGPEEAELDGLAVAAARLSDPRACEAATATSRPSPAQEERVTILEEKLAELQLLELQGDYVASRELAREVALGAEEVGYPPLVATTLIALGRSERLNHNGEGAVEALRGALDLAEAEGLDSHAADASSLLTKVAALELHDAKLGDEWAKQSERKLDRIDADKRRRAELLNNVGLLAYEVRRDFVAAAEAHQRALELRRELVGEGAEARLLVADSLLNLGNVNSARGRFDSALELYTQARGVVEGLLGARHPRVAELLHAESLRLHSQGERELALERAREALAIYEEKQASDLTRAELHYLISALHLRGDEYEEAVAAAKRGVAIADESPDTTDNDRAWLLDCLGAAERGLYVMLRDTDRRVEADEVAEDAVAHFDLALAGLERAQEPDGAVLVSALNNRGDLLQELGRYDEAARSFARAEELLREDDALRAGYLSTTLKGRALVELAGGDAQGALATLERALATVAPDTEPGFRVELAFLRAKATHRGGRSREALDLAGEALAQARRHDLVHWASDISAWIDEENKQPRD